MINFRFLPLLSLLLVAIACEKDPAVPEDALADDGLDTYIDGYATAKTQTNVLAFAGNHRSFEEDTPENDLHIYSVLPTDANDVRLYLSDSLDQPDSLQYFKLRQADMDRSFQGFLGRLSLSTPGKRKLAHLSYIVGDSLFLSSLIVLPGRSDTTSGLDGFSDEQELPGRATFRWDDGPDQDLYMFQLQDRSNDVFCAVTTERNLFRFHDLRNIEQDFTPELFDPRLTLGETYTCTVFAISDKGWVKRFGQRTFRHE